MKKYLVLLLSLLLLFTSCNNSINSTQTKKTTVNNIEKKSGSPLKKTDKLKAVTYDYNQYIFPAHIKDNGFNTVILSCRALRSPSGNYEINQKMYDTLMTRINYLDSNDMDYILSFCEGPGFSYSENISSIFDNKNETSYFAQMIIDVVSKCSDDPNFKGISIDINAGGIDNQKYYGTINDILYLVNKKYPSIGIIYNLTIDAFNSGYQNELLKYIPEFDNLYINARVCIDQLSYPGNCQSGNELIKLNRTNLLDKFESLKEFQDKKKKPIIITVKIPWVDKSDIFLQDIFEIAKTLDFNYNVYSSNSKGNFDFSYVSSVLRVIKKNNQ